MPDISMCDNQVCTLKETCYRFKAKPCEFMQTYGVFKQEKDNTCEYYWEIKKEKDENNRDSQNR